MPLPSSGPKPVLPVMMHRFKLGQEIDEMERFDGCSGAAGCHVWPSFEEA